MVNTNVIGGADGVTFPPGVTNQSTLATFDVGASLESSANQTSFLINPPSQNNYVAWSMITEDAIATSTHPATGTNLLTRVLCYQSKTITACDIWPLSNVANITAFYIGVYSAAGVQLALSAESHAALVNGTQNTITVSAGGLQLVGGTFYYVVIGASWATGAPTFAGCNGANAASLNAGLTVSTAEAASNGTTMPPPASYTMASNVFQAFEYFVALH